MAFVPGANDPFYSFNRFMLGGSNNPSTQLGQDYLEDNPNVAWNRHLASLGFTQGDTSPFAEFARKQQQNAILGWQTALVENPTLALTEYLTPLNRQRLAQMFQYLSPTQRGENQGRFVGPTRTISDI